MTFGQAVTAALSMRADDRPGVARLFQELLATATEQPIIVPAAEPVRRIVGHRSIGNRGNKYGRRGKAKALALPAAKGDHHVG